MIVVPDAFREMPRWWHDSAGRAWLDELPALVDERCRRWGLALDGEPTHGSNALVVPVRRRRNDADDGAVLRLASPGDDIATEAAALTHWRDAPVVRLLDADTAERALLLERLDAHRSLADEPVLDAVRELGRLAREMAVPPDPSAPTTADIAADHVASFAADWAALGEPVPRGILDSAVGCAKRLASAPGERVSANGDLHFAQGLRGRGRWIVVDPVLLTGDPEYDLGRVLWSRLDELPSDADAVAAFDAFVAAAEVSADRARDWVMVRAMSYLLWGLARGLTWDPPKCVRLLELFAVRGPKPR